MLCRPIRLGQNTAKSIAIRVVGGTTCEGNSKCEFDFAAERASPQELAGSNPLVRLCVLGKQP
eukprot:105695-Rhodomonas_salina.4